MKGWSPDYLVMLEGANDAARDSIASFEVRIRRFMGDLEGNITAGLIKRPKGIVYVTCPTRQYKWSGHPGRAVCPDGAHKFETCQVCISHSISHISLKVPSAVPPAVPSAAPFAPY